MESLLLLLICFALGILFRRLGCLPDGTAGVLNAFIIYVSLPSLTLLHLHDVTLDLGLIYPVAMAWTLFAVGVLFFWLVRRLSGWTPQTMAALILTGSLANTSFVGLPMIEAFYGKQNGELAIGILIDQLGTYMVLCTLGVLVAVLYSSGTHSLAAIVRKIALFPPFIALMAALLLMPVAYPAWLEQVLERLGSTLTPLALISVGLQLRLAELRGRLRTLAVGLGYKLMLGPAVILWLFTGVFSGEGQIIQITIFEAAMGPQIGGAIVAMEHKLDKPLVTLMVGIGIPLSLLTLPIWWYLLLGF